MLFRSKEIIMLLKTKIYSFPQKPRMEWDLEEEVKEEEEFDDYMLMSPVLPERGLEMIFHLLRIL